MSVRNRNSGLIRIKLAEVFKDEFGDHSIQHLNIHFGDDSTVIIEAVGDVEKNKWVVNFWSEAYAANFFAIWDRIPDMNDVIRFWNLAFPGGGAEMIEPIKLDQLCSESEEWLLPDDVTMWDAFFAHFQ